MSNSWKARARRALAERGADSEFETDTVATTEELDGAARYTNLQYARSYSPAASYPEEVLVRLHGPRVKGRGLQPEWASLLPHLQSVFNEAAPRSLSTELVDISEGSSVLHLRAVESTVPQTSGAFGALDFAVDESPLSLAAEKILSLVEELNHRTLAHGKKKLAIQLSKLATDLQKNELLADLTLAKSDGRYRKASFERDAMNFLHELQEEEPHYEKMTISGRVTELKSPAQAKVKAGVHRNSAVYYVDFEPTVLTSLRPYLTDEIHWKVLKTEQRDGLGSVKSVSYSFVESLDR